MLPECILLTLAGKLGWLGRLDGLGWPRGCGSWPDGQPPVDNGLLLLLDWAKVIKLLSSGLGQHCSDIIGSVIQSFKDS